MKLSYDLHTHILPSFDDGARNTQAALELISKLNEQGITNICLTPHFYTHKESVEDFLSRRDEAFFDFKPYIPEGVNIKIGAEVFVTQYLFTQEADLKPLCIEDTPYMIAEFPYESDFKGESLSHLQKLFNIGIVPIIPHVERYPNLFNNKALLDQLIYMGVVVQSNAVSFRDFFKRIKLINLIKNGYIHVLSSDAHSMTRNTPEAFSDALEHIRKKCGLAKIYELQNNASAVFRGERL